MSDDERPVHDSAQLDDHERHFETPRLVRELPQSGRPPAGSEAAVETDISERPGPAQPGPRFMRRWDQVQTAWVARGNRGPGRLGGRPPTIVP